MRTGILVLGLIFLYIVAEHWGVKVITDNNERETILTFIIIFILALLEDLMSVFRDRK